MFPTTAVLLAGALQATAPPPLAPPPPSTPTCTRAEFHQLDFWIGRWEVYPTGTNKHVADSVVEGLYGGCAIRENWMPNQPNADGGSLSSYAPREKLWKQTWIDASGSHVEFVGGWDGQKMAITGDWPTATTPLGEHNYVRMMYAPNPDGSVRQWGEASRDGKTWKPSFDLTYRRVAK